MNGEAAYEPSEQSTQISSPQQVPQPPEDQSEDAALEEVLYTQRATIKVVGCGGGGNNTVDRISEVGIEGA
ncbi:cell division protein FtsZ, partial [Candidatus Woesearchaeota archaeon]|nr:cell division protein FtsZ [Candidatus Woesearchaeota archaeon]